LGLTIFGLTPDLASQVRVNVFKQIHEILFHGKGGYDYNTIYNMPLWLRKFTFKEIDNYYREEEAAYKNQTKGSGETNLIDADGKVNVQQFKNASKDYKGKSSYK